MSGAIIGSPLEFLNSYEAFSKLYKKAIFAQKSFFLGGEYTKAEQAVLETFGKFRNTPDEFPQNVRTIQTTHSPKELESVIRKIMRLPFPPQSAGSDPVLSDSRNISFASDFLPLASREEDTDTSQPYREGWEEDLDIDPLIGEEAIDGSSEMGSFSPAAIGSKALSEGRDKETLRPLLPRPLSLQERSSLLSASSRSLDHQLEELKIDDAPIESSEGSILTLSTLDELKDRETFDRCIEGAVILKYLFPELFQKMFRTEEDRHTVQLILAVYGITRFGFLSLGRAVDQAFPQAPKNLSSVIDRLTNGRTIPAFSKKTSSLSHYKPVPDYLVNHPCFTEEQMEMQLHFLGQFRYQFFGLYTVMKPEMRQCLNTFCAAVFIRDFMAWPIEECLRTAFAGKYPSPKELNDLLAETGAVPFSKSAPMEQTPVDEIRSYPYLKYPVLFEKLLAKAQLLSQKHHGSSFIAKQIKAMQTLKDECYMSHEAALDRCFNQNVIQKFAGNVSQPAAIKKALEQLEQISPACFFSLDFLKTPEDLSELKQKAQGALGEALAEAELVLQQNLDMEPIYAVRAVFDDERLEALFGLGDAYQNAKALEEAVRTARRP